MVRYSKSFQTALALCYLSVLPGCGAALILNSEIWSETTVAVLGGTIMATNGNGDIAWHRRHDFGWKQLGNWLNPIQEAHAVNTCQNLTTATCDGSGVLQMFWNDCLAGGGIDRTAYKRAYVHIIFPDNATCLTVAGTGFTAGVIAGLAGKTITRNYGELPTQNSDQNNFVVNRDNLALGVYTIFPSGWTGDKRKDGINVTFVDANTRKISITGIHALPFAKSDGLFTYVTDNNVDLNVQYQNGPPPDGVGPWDHTLNTVKLTDVPYSAGPAFNLTDYGMTFASEDAVDSPAAVNDGDAYVIGYGANTTVKKGATIRTQHNHSKSTGVTIVTDDLVWSSATCCWPTSGKVRTEYDRFFNGQGLMPWQWEELTFGPDCGKVKYVTSEGDTDLDQMYQCW